MDIREMRQLSLRYSFPFKFFELIQFGAQDVLNNFFSFSEVFSRIKELNLFASSEFYLKSISVGYKQDEFGNYLIALFQESDYEQISFNHLIEEYEFPAERYKLSNMAPYWRTTPRYIDPEIMHQTIQAALKLHISNTAEIYRFCNPTIKERFCSSGIWEDLQHYLCIDRDRKLIQLITSGFD